MVSGASAPCEITQCVKLKLLNVDFQMDRDFNWIKLVILGAVLSYLHLCNTLCLGQTCKWSTSDFCQCTWTFTYLVTIICTLLLGVLSRDPGVMKTTYLHSLFIPWILTNHKTLTIFFILYLFSYHISSIWSFRYKLFYSAIDTESGKLRTHSIPVSWFTGKKKPCLLSGYVFYTPPLTSDWPYALSVLAFFSIFFYLLCYQSSHLLLPCSQCLSPTLCLSALWLQDAASLVGS